LTAARSLKVPHTLALIFLLAALTAALTWVIPGGEYEYVDRDGRRVAVPGTFAYVERNPQGPWELLQAPIRGMNEVSYIVVFVLMVGGVFSLIQKTGAIHAAIRWVAAAHRRNAFMRACLIPIVMVGFSLAGATFGMSEEVIPFVLLFIPLARRLGYDSITGVCMCYVAAHTGFAGAFMNPFTVGIAQGIAELDLFSGMGYRFGVWVLLTAVVIFVVMRHATRVRANPRSSPVYDLDREYWSGDALDDPDEGERIEPRQRYVLWLLLGMLAGLVVGVTRLDWYITEIGALFLGVGILAAMVGGLRVNEIAVSFIAGAKELVGPALMIGFARGILILAREGEIIDTILHWLSRAISVGHPVFSAQLMFVAQTFINFLIPSASGQAALTMPIMAPLGDLVGVTRQTAVLAFQLGDGFTNMIVPTAPVLMGVLGLSKIPWDVWARWMLPRQLLFFGLGLLLMVPPVLWSWGPF
jgi:uncharacterized ion transporter superfamily protein YfcC